MKLIISILIAFSLIFCGCSGHQAESLQWSLVNVNLTENILDISFADKNHGWAVTDSGQVISTQDGGKSWQISRVSEKPLTAVYAIDKKTVWIAGWDGTIFSSLEGAGSWNDRSLPENVDFVQIAFWDKKNGVMVGNHLDRDSNIAGAVYRTENGGSEWIEVYLDVDSIACLWILGQGLGWIGSVGHIWQTKDFGVNWEDLPQASAITINSLYFDFFSSGYLVGDTGTYYTSFDGGWSWDNRGGQFPKLRLNAIIFTDRFNGYIVGEKGLRMISSNGGDNWSFDQTLTSADLYALEPVGKNLWVCGAGGTLIHVH